MKLNGKFLAVKYERYFPAFSRRNAKDGRDLREKRTLAAQALEHNAEENCMIVRTGAHTPAASNTIIQTHSI